MVSGQSKLVAVGAMATISGLIYGAWWYNNKYLKNKPPTNWVRVGEVSELCIYPIKSFKAVKPGSFECTPFGARNGLIRDRTFAVLDDSNNVISGRIYPRISQIVPKFNDTTITLSSPDHPCEISFSINDIKGEPKKFEIWEMPVLGWDCGDEVAKWISKCILKEASGLRLLYCGIQDRAKAINKKITNITNITKIPVDKTDGGFFSDAVSYHLISEVSIKHLNSRSNGEIISPLNFRPNFVVKGDKLIPFEEDNWKWLKVGDVIFQNIAPCVRCIFTTVNPNTGERSKSMEPLTSMKRYRNLRDPKKRKVLPSPAMGIYLGLRSLGGKVSVGDPIYVPEA